MKIRFLMRLLLPPLVPVLVLLLFCGWVVYTETNGGMGTIDGRPDNAPRRAALMIAMFCPVLYVILGIFNAIDALLEKWRPHSWMGTCILVGVSSVLIASIGYRPATTPNPMWPLVTGIVLSLLTIIPISVIRRLIPASRCSNSAKIYPPPASPR